MSGKLCDGNTLGKGVVKWSKAYCEGMTYRQSGTAAAKPKTNNPHATTSEAHTAWDSGWDVADAAAGSTISVANAGCCALRGASVSA